MDPKSAAQVIRDTVSMDEILALYGYTTRRGFMVCPFHGDTDASLKVYKGSGGWHCFGCGRGGSVIDFVMEHEGCDFRTAVIAIDKALRMGLQNPKENPYRVEAEKRKQEYLDNFVEAVYAYCKAVRMSVEVKLRMDLARVKELEMMKQTGQASRLTAADYDFMNTWKTEAEYDEYRLERIDAFREEVAAWRRRHRRAASA